MVLKRVTKNRFRSTVRPIKQTALQEYILSIEKTSRSVWVDDNGEEPKEET